MRYSLKRATLWNLIGYIYLIIASFVATPILLHSLGLAQFSSYSLIIGTLMLVSACNLGLPQAVVRVLSQRHKLGQERQGIWDTAGWLFFATGLGAGLLAIGLTHFLHLPTTISRRHSQYLACCISCLAKPRYCGHFVFSVTVLPRHLHTFTLL